ncbi:MAG: Calx-beta domain-containing protein [Planctomycetia bacterium]
MSFTIPRGRAGLRASKAAPPITRSRPESLVGVEQFEPRRVMAANLFPLGETFNLSSLPSATKTLYLDFTGHRTIGTEWNLAAGDQSIFCNPFTEDAGGEFSFNASELGTIQQVWAAVAEDFAPFNINVTTKEPPVSDLVRSSAADQRWGVRAVISDASIAGDENPVGSAQGVAYLDSFNNEMRSVDTPCFISVDGIASRPIEIGLVVTHEVGHTLGLDHHGFSSTGDPTVPPIDGDGDYYPGHGAAGTSWGPIMGAPYGRGVTQWSHGEYASASRPTQDDLAVITKAENGIGYRADDVGGTFFIAKTLAKPLGQVTQVSSGIIERNTDSDMFVFSVSGGGPVDIRATPLTLINAGAFTGANLDVGMQIYSWDKRLVATVELENRLDAQYSATLASGRYYAKIYGTGNAEPAIDGYSSYGSLGQYTITVTDRTPTPPLLPTLAVAGPALAVAEGGLATFTITLSTTSSTQFQVGYRTVSGTAVARQDFVSRTGYATFRPGQSTFTVSIQTRDDRVSEGYEDFYLEVFAVPKGVAVTAARGTARIQFSDGGSPVSPVYASAVAAGAAVSGGVSAKTTAFARYR